MPLSAGMMDLFPGADYRSVDPVNTSLAQCQSLVLYLEMNSMYSIASERLISKTKHKILPPVREEQYSG